MKLCTRRVESHSDLTDLDRRVESHSDLTDLDRRVESHSNLTDLDRRVESHSDLTDLDRWVEPLGSHSNLRYFVVMCLQLLDTVGIKRKVLPPARIQAGKDTNNQLTLRIKVGSY